VPQPATIFRLTVHTSLGNVALMLCGRCKGTQSDFRVSTDINKKFAFISWADHFCLDLDSNTTSRHLQRCKLRIRQTIAAGSMTPGVNGWWPPRWLSLTCRCDYPCRHIKGEQQPCQQQPDQAAERAGLLAAGPCTSGWPQASAIVPGDLQMLSSQMPNPSITCMLHSLRLYMRRP